MILRKIRINKRDVAWTLCIMSLLYFYSVGIPSLVSHLTTVMGLDKVRHETVLQAKEVEPEALVISYFSISPLVVATVDSFAPALRMSFIDKAIAIGRCF